MKRKTAIRYLSTIAERLHGINGLLATPNTCSEAVRCSRVWVFGSTAKGSALPNDLDILIEAKEAGRRYAWTRGRKLDREYTRRYGMNATPSSMDEFLKWLTRGMRKVSRHRVGNECMPIDVKILIYPKWKLNQTLGPDCRATEAPVA